MTDEEKQHELARYRIMQADESIKEAHYLLSAGMSLRSVLNRVYYAMFYAVLAILIYEPYSSSKQSGVISYFNRRFIKEGIFPKSIGETFQDAFELRQDGDYKEFFELPEDKVVDILTKSEHFIEEIRAYLKNTGRL
ncbi:MAG: HEPN domain-containing protein [Candidatus Xenobiia bacterium LiM19]